MRSTYDYVILAVAGLSGSRHSCLSHAAPSRPRHSIAVRAGDRAPGSWSFAAVADAILGALVGSMADPSTSVLVLDGQPLPSGSVRLDPELTNELVVS
jgi:hypothetical protein